MCGEAGSAPGTLQSPLRERERGHGFLQRHSCCLAGGVCQQTPSLRAKEQEGPGGRAPAWRLRGWGPKRGRERRVHGPGRSWLSVPVIDSRAAVTVLVRLL